MSAALALKLACHRSLRGRALLTARWRAAKLLLLLLLLV
jgi:hypothetical protein